MSDEQKKLNEEKMVDDNYKFILIIIFSVLSLLFSVSALTLSIVNYKNSSNPPVVQQEQQIQKPAQADKDAISVKYDKGQSLTKAKSKNKPIIAFFYTDWCGFCQRFAPTFNEISKDARIKKDFAVAYINCEDSKNDSFVREYEIQAYPTVYVIDAKGEKTKLENGTFFEENALETVIGNSLKAIGK